MTQAPDGPLLLYDGECGLCDRSVQFTIRHDPAARVKFATLQGDLGRRLLQEAGLPEDYRDSLVLIDNAGTHVKSDAAHRLAGYLQGRWRSLRWTRVIPRPIRDWGYDFVANRRFRWFGRADTCRLPSPGERERFLG